MLVSCKNSHGSRERETEREKTERERETQKTSSVDWENQDARKGCCNACSQVRRRAGSTANILSKRSANSSTCSRSEADAWLSSLSLRGRDGLERLRGSVNTCTVGGSQSKGGNSLSGGKPTKKRLSLRLIDCGYCNLLPGNERHTTPHHTTPRHATPHHTTPHHTTPHHTTPHHTTPHHTTPRHATLSVLISPIRNGRPLSFAKRRHRRRSGCP